MSKTKRYAARAILVTPANEVLLMRMAFPWDTEHKWILPGGGIEPGENAQQACTRELWEETGLTDVVSLAHVWHRTFYVPKAKVQLSQEYFWCEVEKFAPAPARLSAAEHQWFKEFRWWSLPQLTATEEYFEPDLLVPVIEDIRARGIPSKPYDIDNIVR